MAQALAAAGIFHQFVNQIPLSYNGSYVRFANDPAIVSLRRGTCTLHGGGVIGLGSSPTDATAPCVNFEVLKFSDTEPQVVAAN